MLEGLMTGLVGAIAAAVLLFLAKTLLNRVEFWTDERSSVAAMPFMLNAFIIVVVGLILGAVGSALTLRRFLHV
jgi:cell division protein FtsX